jgi:hypothetical protein
MVKRLAVVAACVRKMKVEKVALNGKCIWHILCINYIKFYEINSETFFSAYVFYLGEWGCFLT